MIRLFRSINCRKYLLLNGIIAAAFLHVTTWFSIRSLLDDDGLRMRGLESKPMGNSLVRQQEDGNEASIEWRTPTMHTFFEPVPGGCCGMSEEGHQRLIQAWESSWRASGWETQILTMDDAKKHKDFDKLSEILERFNVDEYNKRCFYRWLAMAEIGGWMSDYDTFPLNFSAEVGAKLAQYGEFTSLEGPVPSLIQANKQEWERIIQTMMELLELRKDDDKGIISDMYMLEKIKTSLGTKAGRFARPKTLVVPGLPYVYDKIEDENDRKLYCNALKNKLAIHFSHKSTNEAFSKGRFPIKSGISDVRDAMERRSSAALVMLEDKKKQCPEEEEPLEVY